MRAHDLGPDEDTVADVVRRTSGRPADVVRAVRDLAAEQGHQGDRPVGADALAGLPLLSPGLVDPLLGPGAWRRLAASGSTLHRRSDGWYVPAVESHRPRATGSDRQRRRAAHWYADHG